MMNDEKITLISRLIIPFSERLIWVFDNINFDHLFIYYLVSRIFGLNMRNFVSLQFSLSQLFIGKRSWNNGTTQINVSMMKKLKTCFETFENKSKLPDRKKYGNLGDCRRKVYHINDFRIRSQNCVYWETRNNYKNLLSWNFS